MKNRAVGRRSRWTSTFYLLVAKDGLPDCNFRMIYSTPETPEMLMERWGMNCRILVFDVKDGKVWEPKGSTEEQP